MEGNLSSWPDAFYGASPRGTTIQVLTNRWSVGEGPDRRDYELETLFSYPTATALAPATSLRQLTPEIPQRLTVRFASPEFTINWWDNEEPLAVAWVALPLNQNYG